jgi:transcriptional regulator with XRE-family HTH domain
MSPEDVKALRNELKCNARELGSALGVEQSDVLAWERGELFPTKALVAKMAALRARGADAIERVKPKGGAKAGAKKAASVDGVGLDTLADPATWQLIRKLLVHSELRAAALQLAAEYEDVTGRSVP